MEYEQAKAIMWLGLAVLFVVGGLALVYVSWRLGRLLRGVEGELHRTVDGVVPLMTRAGTSMDQVNRQLGKVDVMMDSAVDMVDAVDTSVRAVSHAVVEPVKVAGSAVAGAGAALRSFRVRMLGDDDGESEDGGVRPSGMAADEARAGAHVDVDDHLEDLDGGVTTTTAAGAAPTADTGADAADARRDARDRFR